MKKFFLFTKLFILCLSLGFSAQAKDVCGPIELDETWRKVDSPIIVTCDVTVMEGVTLTIEPGVEVRFDQDKSLTIDGTLIVRGTIDDKIIFTSNGTQEPGYWGYIFFANSSTDATFDPDGNYTGGCIIQYAIVEYGGSGGSVITIDAASPFLDNSTIENNAGAGISVTESLFLISNCQIRINSGGGINFSKGSNSAIKHCEISENSAPGILATKSTIQIQDGTMISGNSSGSDGAGIYAASCNVVIQDSTISGNSISQYIAGQYGGGGIRALSCPIVTIQNSIISGNSTSGYDHYGGGVRVSSSTVTIENSTISENSVSSLGIGYGGGISAEDDCTVTLKDSEISGNSVDSEVPDFGGGIYVTNSSSITIQSSEIITNKSGGSGGGIYALSPTVTIQNSTISGNSAAYGGGIWSNNKAIIEGNTFKDNTAVQQGGAIWASGKVEIKNNDLTKGDFFGNTAPSGAAIYVSGTVILQQNSITQNQAPKPFGCVLRLVDIDSDSVIGGSEENGNVIVDNTGDGVYFKADAAFNYNRICGNSGYEFVSGNPSGSDIDATNNFWGTTGYEEIDEEIWDCKDDDTLGCVTYKPVAGPAISNVVPQSRGQGATGQNIVITGTNFVGGSVVSFSCDGITVNSINYESSTELIVNIDIASDATIGYCAVIVTNPDGKADEDMFELTNSPEVKSANPGSLLQGAENRDVIIEGNYFVDNLPGDPNGDQLTADFGDGVIVHSVTCVNPTKLIANITVAWDAEVKDRPVKVINGDAGVGISDDDIFTVLAIGPTISIRTDKEAYQPGNEMYVYADFSNPTDESVLGIAALFLVKLHPILQLYDISFHFMLPDSETKDDVLYDGSPPVDKPWTYAWLGVLFSKKDGYLDSSVAVWSYETPLSAANTERIKRIAEEYVQNLTLNTVLTLKSAKDFEKDTAIIPAQSLLLQNTPNPFNPETWIPYKLAESTAVTIKIYNITGQLVRSLDLGQKDAGLYLSKDKAAYWDGRDNLGEKVSSGVYFYTLQAGQFRATRKMVILK